MFAIFRWDYIRDGSNLVKDMDRLDAFFKGLTTWAGWVDQNLTKLKFYFKAFLLLIIPISFLNLLSYKFVFF